MKLSINQSNNSIFPPVTSPYFSIHQGDSVNDAILHAIFGDGCAVALVRGLTARTAKPGSLAVLDNRSWLVRTSAARRTQKTRRFAL